MVVCKNRFNILNLKIVTFLTVQITLVILKTYLKVQLLGT